MRWGSLRRAPSQVMVMPRDRGIGIMPTACGQPTGPPAATTVIRALSEQGRGPRGRRVLDTGRRGRSGLESCGGNGSAADRAKAVRAVEDALLRRLDLGKM